MKNFRFLNGTSLDPLAWRKYCLAYNKCIFVFVCFLLLLLFFNDGIAYYRRSLCGNWWPVWISRCGLRISLPLRDQFFFLHNVVNTTVRSWLHFFRQHLKAAREQPPPLLPPPCLTSYQRLFAWSVFLLQPKLACRTTLSEGESEGRAAVKIRRGGGVLCFTSEGQKGKKAKKRG